MKNTIPKTISSHCHCRFFFPGPSISAFYCPSWFEMRAFFPKKKNESINQWQKHNINHIQSSKLVTKTSLIRHVDFSIDSSHETIKENHEISCLQPKSNYSLSSQVSPEIQTTTTQAHYHKIVQNTGVSAGVVTHTQLIIIIQLVQRSTSNRCCSFGKLQIFTSQSTTFYVSTTAEEIIFPDIYAPEIIF